VKPCGLVGVYQHLEGRAVLIVQAICVWPRVTDYLCVATCHRRFICGFKHYDDETVFKVMFSQPSVVGYWLVLMEVKSRCG